MAPLQNNRNYSVLFSDKLKIGKFNDGIGWLESTVLN